MNTPRTTNKPWENADGSTNVDGFIEAFAKDDNTFWRASSGHHMNIIEELIERNATERTARLEAEETLKKLKNGLRNNNTDFEIAFLDAYLENFKTLRLQLTLAQKERDEIKESSKELVKENQKQGDVIANQFIEITKLQKERDEARAELRICQQMENSFWAARKKLNLQSVNVQDPGQDITDYIDSLRAELRKALETLESAKNLIGQFRLKEYPPTQETWEKIEATISSMKKVLSDE